MKQIAPHEIGVCSWTLRAKSAIELATKARAVGLDHVQLGLQPWLAFDEVRRQKEVADLRASGLVITATMINFPGEDYTTIQSIRNTGGFVPDITWPARRDLAILAANLSAEIGVPLLSTHAGFIPSKNALHYRKMVDRLKELADAFAATGIQFLLESGQESAQHLVTFLDDVNRPNLGVNFDPANMILYGAGDPIEAIGLLAARIRHVHVKDAVASDQPGEIWGEEQPFGRGAVNPRRFLKALADVGYSGPLVIECETSDGAKNVSVAVEALRDAMGG